MSEPFIRLGEDYSRTAQQKGSRQKPKRHTVTLAIIWSIIMIGFGTIQAQSQPSLPESSHTTGNISKSSKPGIWQDGVGDGFKVGVQSICLSVGAGYGVRILGSKQSHDLALADLAYGYTLDQVAGEGHWYRGNWELRGELFGAGQFSPTSDSVVGIAPHLRYDFVTGTRWVPYIDAGAGVTATSIGPPDLSNTFEFNLQASTGMRWFIRDNLALGIEARYLHLSCAGLHTPNLGLNNVNGMLSITWFF